MIRLTVLIVEKSARILVAHSLDGLNSEGHEWISSNSGMYLVCRPDASIFSKFSALQTSGNAVASYLRD